ncbi:sugar ABC transporter substrate-binding protein [Allobranchiibius sp. GilTou73]|uniref:ABC transporter substrate-binding protein n=1 Tax=Allobranchiibius sp. GilTou73 TaxID=2904523 RepID=UPI001F29F5DD|nr:sugar ABC transporter substrate-binding protein [Allobranchiibius sp. GilTou73]UIJ34208.1 sugar ABC transporter substrate-binding protein [Allobranchiibius sp. GilTou73]
MRSTQRIAISVAVIGLGAAGLSACSASSGGSGGGDKTLNVLMVNNPQMEALKQVAPEFTKATGIKVNFKDLPENDLRSTASTEFAQQAGQYDLATLSNFEIPIYAKKGWVADLTKYTSDPKSTWNGKDFDQSDILKPMATSLTVNNKIYGEPFYGESSFLMYRKDLFKAAGLTMPANPTWQQVAGFAQKLKKGSTAGICLRGAVGWGQVMAPLTTVVNTMGGTWFDSDWNAQINTGGFAKATNFYVDLVKKYGEPGAAQAGFTECDNAMIQGQAAMWYDATSAAGTLQSSKYGSDIGYAPAPVDQTKSSGWLYTWAWGVESASKKKDAAWKFISWASGKDYLTTVGNKTGTGMGWANVPAGARTSLYSNPNYLKVASSFAQPTLAAINSADPNNTGRTNHPPVPGIQFVDVPEFTDFGQKVSQEISNAIAGSTSVSSALNASQSIAQAGVKAYKK